MKIVIDIPDTLYNTLMKNKGTDIELDFTDRLMLECAATDGKPLPKGHGDLKDMSNLQYVFDLTREDTIYSGKDIERAIKSMTTIVEADSEVKND